MTGSIALVQLPHFYNEKYSRPPECYPLGLGYISSALKEHGIEHDGVDLWGLQYTVDEALELIDFGKFDFIGISAYATQYKYLKSFTLGLKRKYPGKPIICGGPGPTFSWDIILRNTGVDVCVIGEGEITIIDLLGHFDNLGSVKGIGYKDSGNVICTEAREYIKDLDSIRFPDRMLFDFRKIMETANSVRVSAGDAGFDISLRKSADIIAGRGCPFHCNYCSKTFRGVRFRSIDNFISEVEGLISDYGINHLQFNDELVLVNKKRTLQLCSRLKGLGITWSCQGRIDQVDEEILKAMKMSGCVQVGYGVESVSQPILENMNKRLDANKIIPIIQLTRKIGIEPIIQYMYGYPGETNQSIKETIAFFKQIDHPYIGFSTTLIPGTKLYMESLTKGLIDNEEEYLLKLDSGYNLSGSLINLTDFTDKEYLYKKRILELRVNHNYYIRRPLEYGRYILSLIKAVFLRVKARII